MSSTKMEDKPIPKPRKLRVQHSNPPNDIKANTDEITEVITHNTSDCDIESGEVKLVNHLYLPRRIGTAAKVQDDSQSKGKWKTVAEAANGFQQILESGQDWKKFHSFVFNEILQSSLQEKTFRDEMASCDALFHWDDRKHVLKTNWEEIDVKIALGCIQRKETQGRDEDDQINLETAQLAVTIETRQHFPSTHDSSNNEKSVTLIPDFVNLNSIEITETVPLKISGYGNQSTIAPDLEPLAEGNNLPKMFPKDYIEIKALQHRPTFKADGKNLMETILPYIIQKIKMYGCDVILAHKVSLLLENLSDSNEADNICRLDILTSISCSTEVTVLAEIFRVLSLFPVALPLVVHDLGNKAGEATTYKMLLPALTKSLVRWESGKRIAENYLFRSQYRLITAFRIGYNSVGKSSILNQIFKQSNLFHNCGQSGEGQPMPSSLPGSCEFIWLTKDTCNDVVWSSLSNCQPTPEGSDEIILLANLHGNILQHWEVLKSIVPMTTKFIAFVMEDELESFQSHRETIAEICGADKHTFVFVGPKHIDLPPIFAAVIDPQFLIDHSTMKVLRSLLSDMVKNGQTNGALNYDSEFHGNSVSIVEALETPESKSFLKCLYYVKEKLSRNSLRFRDVMLLQQQRSINLDKFREIWSKGEYLMAIIEKFVRMLKLPLDERRRSIAHIERELAIISKERLDTYERELNCLHETHRGFHESSDGAGARIHEILYKEINDTFGMEHIIREVGRVHEMMIFDPHKDSLYSDLPELYSDLLLEGMTIEILDGDIGTISGIWLEAVCHSVCRKLPNLNVFVLSILGLQSSGKSTLLNALFGCKFVVSVGKCTRGIFMRLLFLEESYRSELKVDAILIIDTEGLSSPDNMLDADAEIKDRMMATFAMTISNLTLINVRDETKKGIVDILQIVILTMARLEDAQLSPDILLVQHVAEGGSEIRLLRGVQEFFSALEEAIQVVEKNELEWGNNIRKSKNLENLQRRIRTKDILMQIRPFKRGATPQSPPTEEYHEDVVVLRERILQVCKTNEVNRIGFCNWHKLLKSYWKAVQEQNFALRFINIRQMQEFFDINSKLEAAKNAFATAFRNHERTLQYYIQQELDALKTCFEPTSILSVEERVFQTVDIYLDNIIKDCVWGTKPNAETPPTRCKYCTEAEEARKQLWKYIRTKQQTSLKEIEESIKVYTGDLRKLSKSRLLQSFESEKIQEGKVTEFDTLLDDIIKQQFGDRSKVHLTKESTELVFDLLSTAVSDKYPIQWTRERIIQDVVEHYLIFNKIDVEHWKEVLTGNDLLKLQDVSSETLESMGMLRRILSLFKGGSTKLKRQSTLKANECIWLGEQLSAAATAIFEKNNGKSYETEWPSEHKNAILGELENFKRRFRAIDVLVKWDVILIAVQMFLTQASLLQEQWNAANEPLCIFLQRKEEYLKKIRFTLEPQLDIIDMGNNLSEKLIAAVSKVTSHYIEASEFLIKWTNTVEGIRLRYFTMLAESVQAGHLEIALNHFDNPQSSLIEWFFQEIDATIDIERAVELSKTMFIDECKGICEQVAKAKTAQELNSFITWYLAKTRSFNNAVVTEDTFERVALTIKTQLEKEMSDYSQIKTITDYRISANYDKNTIKLGCTTSCPYCSSMCWGTRAHETLITIHAKHYTCHQPQGLAGVHDATTRELIASSCTNYHDPKESEIRSVDVLSPINDNRLVFDFKDRHDTFWLFTKHPKDEFNELMQWFFLKLNDKLAERHGVLPASNESIIRAMGTDSFDDKLDDILLNIRQRIEI